MKRILCLVGLVMALVVMITPRVEAVTGTVYNGFVNRCDVNRDGSITVNDVTIVYNYLLGTEDVSSYDCDVNLDGAVTTVDVTIIYNVLLNGGYYNSIFDAFNLSVANYFNREYYKFTWDDVTTLGYDVTNPVYLLVIGTDDTFTPFCRIDVGGTTTTIGYESMSEMFRTELGWTSPSDVPSSMNLVARVEVKLDNDKDVIISKEKSFLHIPQLSFESSQPIKLWWLTGSFIGTNHWENISNCYLSDGMVPLYPVQGATYDENGEGPLEYYGYFPAGGEFKIIEEPGSWDKVIGGGNENGGQAYSKNTSDYPDNIIINQGGFYKIDLNTADKTMTMTRLSDSQASYSTITMPGAYQGWVADNNAMTALGTSNSHDWCAFLTIDNDSELKFTPGNWDYDWGSDGFPYGKGNQYGSNIPAKAGSYSVYFNDLSGDYMFIDGENGLPGSNYLKISKYDVGDYVNLALDYASGTTIKLCDISTDLDGPYQLCFGSQSVAIDQDGMVDVNELKEAVFSSYNRPRTGGTLIYCHVEGTAGYQTVKSNTINIPVLMENYSIAIDGGATIEMTPTGVNTYKATIPAGSYMIRFKIVPGSTSDEGDMITSPLDEDITATNGAFGFGKQGFFVIPYNANYKEYEVSIDLGYRTYSIEGKSSSSMIWQVGETNEWGSSPLSGLSLSGTDVYEGFMYLNGDYKFKESETTWDGNNWGEASYTTGATSGNLVVNGYNLNANAGFYKVDVNLNNLTYNLTEITSVSIIGSAVPTGDEWFTDLELTYNQSSGAWEGTFTLNSGEYKFRANHDWSLNWGDSLSNLGRDGANLYIAQSGTYSVKVYLTYPGDCHATVTKQ